MSHPNGGSQVERLYELLRDEEEHTTPEIMEAVYGSEHLGIARIAARVHDLNKRIRSIGYKVVSRKMNQTIWSYKIETIL